MIPGKPHAVLLLFLWGGITPCVATAASPGAFHLQKLRKGLQLLQGGQLSQAEVVFLSVPEAAGEGFAVAQLYLMRLARERGDLDRALAHMRRLKASVRPELRSMLEAERSRLAQACLERAVQSMEIEDRVGASQWTERAKEAEPELASRASDTVESLLRFAREQEREKEESAGASLAAELRGGFSSNRNYSPSESARESGAIASIGVFAGARLSGSWSASAAFIDEEWVGRPSERAIEARAQLSAREGDWRAWGGAEYRAAFGRALQWGPVLGVSLAPNQEGLSGFSQLALGRMFSLRSEDARWSGTFTRARGGLRWSRGAWEWEGYGFGALEHFGSFAVGSFLVPDDALAAGLGGRLRYRATPQQEWWVRVQGQLRMSLTRVEPAHSIRRDFVSEVELGWKRRLASSVRFLADVRYALWDSNLENLQVADYDFKEWTLQAGVEISLTKN